MRVEHPFRPIYDQSSKILILGSFPSVKSREDNFYYAHPQNRFWRVLSKLLDVKLPVTIDEKCNILLDFNIAIWDVLKSCSINGSSDSSIKDPVVNDIYNLVKNSNISAIFFNGNKSYEIYKKYCTKKPVVKCCVLPSTSSANASWSFDRLYKYWEKELKEEL